MDPYLVRIAFPSDNILEELIPAGSQNMQNRYRDYGKRLSASYRILTIRQMEDPEGGYQLGDREEHLMIPLGVKLIVPVIYVHPPGVVVREHGGREEQHHGISESLLNR